MCDNDRTEELEKIIREQKKMIDDLMNNQQTSFKVKVETEKKKADEALKSMVSIFTNKDIQRHFVRAGMEFLSGIEELIKTIPFPDNVKETMDKAYEAKDDIVREVCDLNPSCKYKATGTKKKMKKIDVE